MFLGASFLLVLLVAPPTALACTITASTPTESFTDPWGSTFYVIVMGCGSAAPRCPFAEYIYQESNNYAGLQRDDGFADDTCGHPALADLQIF